MCFASFRFDGFTTMAVIIPQEKKLAKCTSMQWDVFPSFVYLLTNLHLFFQVLCINLV